MVTEQAVPVALVEGDSDALVVRRLLAVRGLRAEVLPMGGITNVAAHLDAIWRQDADRPVVGLCDTAERRFVARALRRHGAPFPDGTDGDDNDEVATLADLGFFVCVRDLEEELIRALGAKQVLAAVDDLGLMPAFETFAQQPQWRSRDAAEQLHRFAGAGSGRKSLLDDQLGARLDERTLPAPLAALVRAVASPPAWLRCARASRPR